LIATPGSSSKQIIETATKKLMILTSSLLDASAIWAAAPVSNQPGHRIFPRDCLRVMATSL
jgi:hypothetical protein